MQSQKYPDGEGRRVHGCSKWHRTAHQAASFQSLASASPVTSSVFPSPNKSLLKNTVLTTKWIIPFLSDSFKSTHMNNTTKGPLKVQTRSSDKRDFTTCTAVVISRGSYLTLTSETNTQIYPMSPLSYTLTAVLLLALQPFNPTIPFSRMNLCVYTEWHKDFVGRDMWLLLQLVFQKRFHYTLIFKHSVNRGMVQQENKTGWKRGERNIYIKKLKFKI